MARNLSRGYTTPWVSPICIGEGSEKNAVLPQQTRMTQSPRSMLLTKLLGTTPQETRRIKKSGGSNIGQKTKLTSQPWSCVLIPSDTTGPPDDDTRYQGPSKRESGPYRDKDRKTTFFSRLFRLIGRGSLYTTATSSSSFISRNSPTSGIGTAWRPYNARSCPSNSWSHPNEVLATS